ncbi:hypothetical protein WR25_16023 [Diploscapter pachys]|uniref:SOSS complex subunit A homolog n=1 Tax=Diploscapter pachys TaxID=2018661 RepID=A0A2A2KNN0_9BILA|nr:hypothetical protein WR25_16023 [Diploscapter pachys]
MADPEMLARVCALVNMRNRADNPNDNALNMAVQSTNVAAKINGLSDKEASDILLKMAGDGPSREQVLLGLLFHFLTKPSEYQKWLNHMTVLSPDQWYTVLCHMNMVLIELYPKLQEVARNQIIVFFREGIKMNIPKIDNVIMNLVRCLNGSGDWQSKLRTSSGLTNLLLENEPWVASLKPGALLAQVSIATFAHLIIDLGNAPVNEPLKQSMVNLVVYLIRLRPQDSQMLGRDLGLILLRLSKIAQISALWKEYVSEPNKFHLNTFDELFFRSVHPQFHQNRVAPEIARKVEFMLLHVKQPQLEKYFEWFSNAYLRDPDASSMRAELIRYILYFTVKDMNLIVESRVHLINLLLVSAAVGAEQQWCKMVLWMDWMFYEPSVPYYAIEPVIALIRFYLNLHHPFANSILEFVCKTVPVLHPPLAESMKKAINQAMRPIADCYQGSLVAILENSRLDKAIREEVRKLWKDFVRSDEGPTASEVKSEDVKEKPVKSPSSSAIQSNSGSNIAQTSSGTSAAPVEKSRSGSFSIVMNPQLKPGHSSESAASRKAAKLETENPANWKEEKPAARSTGTAFSNVHPSGGVKMEQFGLDEEMIDDESSDEVEQEREKQRREQELAQAIEGLRGEWRDIVEGMRENFKSAELDMYEKSEGVQKILQKLLDDDSDVDDDVIENLAQALLVLIGPVTLSIEGANEGDSLVVAFESKDTTDQFFNHSLFVIFRNLCFTAENEPIQRTIVSLIASMRDRDETITYLLLVFMKSGIESQMKVDANAIYKEIADCCGKNEIDMLCEDLAYISVEDFQLFGYLVPYVLDQFQAQINPDLIGAICKGIDGAQLHDLVGEIAIENVTIFRKDSMSAMITASLDWETTSQWIFWQLVNAEGVPIDWIAPSIPKLNAEKHREALTNILLLLRRMDRDPSMSLMRYILARQPSKDDRFTVNAIKILIDDVDIANKVAEHIGGLIRKTISAGDILMPQGTANSTSTSLRDMSRKTGRAGSASHMKLPLEQVLAHMENFTNLCLTKGKKMAEQFLAKNYIQDAIAAAKSFEKAAPLRNRYQQLFTVIEILNDEKDNATGTSRTLRGNRNNTSSSSMMPSSTREPKQKRRNLDDDIYDKDDVAPPKPKRAATELTGGSYIDLSDSD